MDKLQVLRAHNDALERNVAVQLEVVQEAARRIALLERQQRLELEARNLARRVRELERGGQTTTRIVRRGYWETLGL